MDLPAHGEQTEPTSIFVAMSYDCLFLVQQLYNTVPTVHRKVGLVTAEKTGAIKWN